jgi:hypothetical protein
VSAGSEFLKIAQSLGIYVGNQEASHD